MQPIQWSEPFARLRRFSRTVGQQTLALEEVASPVILIAALDEAPFRSEPRLAGSATSLGPGVVANQPIALVLWNNTVAPLPTDGAILIDDVELSTEATVTPDSNQQLQYELHLAAMDGTLGGTGNFHSMEPPSRQGIIAGIQPVCTALSSRATVLNSTVIARVTKRIPSTNNAVEELTVRWRGLNLLLLPPVLSNGEQLALLAQIVGTSGVGVNNLGVALSVRARVFNSYPAR